jgi:hypothetical protein
MAEDYEDFDVPSDDDLEEELEEPLAPTPQSKRVMPPYRTPPRKPRPQPEPEPAPEPAVQKVQTAQAQEAPEERYMLYSMPKRIGVFDRTVNKPIVEDEDSNMTVLALLVKMQNQLDRIEQSLG